MVTGNAVPASPPAPSLAYSFQMATPYPSELEELDAQYNFIVTSRSFLIDPTDEEKSTLQNEILDLRNRLERACMELQATKVELLKKNALEATTQNLRVQKKVAVLVVLDSLINPKAAGLQSNPRRLNIPSTNIFHRIWKGKGGASLYFCAINGLAAPGSGWRACCSA
ncbi:hypothetical protein Pelo_15578 [Pelomyxa schiedti]|nr:hypothetical protein Pelo_15578 [Pelomyxa schiedti]